jgi:6,7-dimethyl-8-ribityllumazine synthase
MTFKETPIVCGVLTTENIEQAIVRSQPGPLNRGAESAVEAIKMAKF